MLKENLRNVGILTREIKYFNLARQLDCFLFVVIERQLLPTTYSMYEGTCLVSQIRTDALSVASGLLWLYPVLTPMLINAHLYVHKSVHLPLWSQHIDK